MRQNNRLKLNNKGTTLVELLVAIAIIAIISGPFVAAFITAARVNNKSRLREEATTAGSNVMEEIRGKSLATLLGYSEYVDDGAGNTIKNPLTPDKYIESLTKVDVSGGFNSAGITTPSGTMGYELDFDSADLTHIDGNEYIVKAYLDPTSSDTTSDPGADPDQDEYTDYNRVGMANIYAMNSKLDGFFMLSETADETAISMFSNGTNVYDVIQNMKRNILLDIKQTNEGGIDKTYVYAKVEYTYNGKKKTISEPKPVYQNTDGTVDLRNIYIFFNPRYEGEDKEYITITNHDLVPCNIYLVKGEAAGVTDTEASPKNNYDVTAVVKEVGRTDFDDQITTIRTNLINKGAIKQLKVDYSPTATKSESEVKKILDINGLTDTKKTDRAFDVVINVYNKDEGGNEKDLVFTFTGTKEN